MSDKINEVINLIKDKIINFENLQQVESFGMVITVGDGIAQISGLREVFFGEIVEFESGTKGKVLQLDSELVGAVILGQEHTVFEGMRAKRTYKSFSVPVGKELLGRVVDVFGNPIDEKGAFKDVTYEDIMKDAPSVMKRSPVTDPLVTGIKVIDAVIPIGRGQRELIIGDRQTGKTAIVIDTILQQKEGFLSGEMDKTVFCIYVAIGQKMSTIAKLVDDLKSFGAMDYSVVVVSTPSDAAILQYLAPYTGCTIGEYFRDNGMHALVAYDDLSKHANAYREISLLLRKPPGREAYPGDIFYVHSKLLERAAKLNSGGSLTALPIIETQAGDISAYIPTNVISITDGQICLEGDLFHMGIKPAVNTGLSVSRIGSAAQEKGMKQVSGKIKLDLAQYRELEAFVKFGSDIDASTQELLKKGRIIVDLFKQDQYSPVSLEKQILFIFAASRGFLNDMKNIHDFLEKLFARLQENNEELLKKFIKGIDQEMEVELLEKITEFLEHYNQINK